MRNLLITELSKITRNLQGPVQGPVTKLQLRIAHPMAPRGRPSSTESFTFFDMAYVFFIHTSFKLPNLPAGPLGDILHYFDLPTEGFVCLHRGGDLGSLLPVQEASVETLGVDA